MNEEQQTMALAQLRKVFGLGNIAIIAATLALAACGGSAGGGSSTSTTTTTPTPTGSPTISLSLVDSTSGAATSSISPGSTVRVNATVLDATGHPVPNVVVTFSVIPTSLVSITPAAATALSDASGVAYVQISPASLSAAGAATVSASASVNGATANGSVGFNVSPASASITALATSIGSGTLAAYGTTSVTATIGGVPTTTPVTVNFTSNCATTPVASGSSTMKASLTTSAQSSNGVATATYQDNGCGALDHITASIAGTTVSSTTTLNVTPPVVGSIQFISATPTTIVLKGTGGGGLQESSIVVFKVVDSNNGPVAGQSVTLDLTTRTGDILLDAGRAAVTKPTDASGLVQVSVQAGTNPTAVQVTATTTAGANTFFTQSSKLIISTGRPAQDRFSLSFTTHNIEGWVHDGTTTTARVIASDRLGNPVPDGTAINFISEGAQVSPTCTTVGGTCSVTFTSANPRPTDGRVTVLAYAVGEESFVDLNGNNVYDAGEPFNDLGDAFVNANEHIDASSNPVFDAGDSFIPFNSTNASDCTTHQGIAGSPKAPSKAMTCDGIWGPAHARQDQIVVLSGPVASVSTTTAHAAGCAGTYTFTLTDVNSNAMAAGTTIATSNATPGITANVLTSPIVDSTAVGGTAVAIAVQVDATHCSGTSYGSFVMTITTPVTKTGTVFTVNVVP
jgi:protocatechuate 3,4-dioxygenase beta subunit